MFACTTVLCKASAARYQSQVLTASMHQCREAVKLDSKHSRALKLLGSALYAEGDLQGAKAALQSALQLKPSYADAYCDLGCVLCALAEVEAAKNAFQNAAQLNPQHLEVMQTRTGAVFLPHWPVLELWK